MVRKKQIGSGVPYAPMSPLDIPTSIPPSDVTESYLIKRVAKFFKTIGEKDPLADQTNILAYEEEEDEGKVERVERVDRGGGGPRRKKDFSPPPQPLHMEVDPETGMLPDGSVAERPGLGGGARLGLGAVADPTEISQYDDVYSSYRKKRSSNYHSAMSDRAAKKYEHT